MTALKIDLARFKEICEAHRETFDPEYWMTFRESLLVDLQDEIRGWGERPVVEKPATFDEIYENLSGAARRLQDFGASDAQVRAIAARWSKEGGPLSAFEMNTLSAQEARAILG